MSASVFGNGGERSHRRKTEVAADERCREQRSGPKDMIASLLPGPLPIVLCGMLVAVFAGFVRGFGGFGLSAFIVAGMSLWLSPQIIVPAAMMLEILASVSLLRSVWPHVSWHWIRPLIAGYAVSVPPGVWCLSILPEVPLRLAVSTIILGMALTLLAGFRPGWGDGIGVRLGTGLVAGFMSGLSSIGGMIAATMLFTTSLPAARLRATLIALFVLSSSYGLAWAAQRGLVHRGTLLWVAWLLVPMLIGIMIGRHGFSRASESQFRRAMLIVLAAVAAVGMIRALWVSLA
jgi:uncharacterized membrane protein YfcA